MEILILSLRFAALFFTFSALSIPPHAFLALFFLWLSLSVENVKKIVDNR